MSSIRCTLPLLALLTVATQVQAELAAPTPSDKPASTDSAGRELEIVTVLGTRDRTATLSGSHQVLDAQALTESHVMTTSEALRKAVGVNVRDEEGFGLRPNIGLRGLNPTRSTKVLLLEDGIPLAYAPYGDNASYYHPPIDRFARIEVLKGAAVNLYGPQTVGGVINYITPTPLDEFTGLVRLTAGDEGYRNVHALVSGAGLQFDVVDKRGDGSRDNQDSHIRDFNAKWLLDAGEDHTLILRANHYIEDSKVSYSGITDAELRNFGYRYNPFRNDEFDARRTGFSITHDWSLADSTTLTTNLYHATFDRDWWRQASTTSDSQCNAVRYAANGTTVNFQAARAFGINVDPNQCNSRQGRLRSYRSYGVEPRVDVDWSLGDSSNQLTLGARFHKENQVRRQRNGVSPVASSGTLVERNTRETRANAVSLQNRLVLGNFEVTPGIRHERIHNDRSNGLNNASGDATTTAWLPSLGMSWQLNDSVSLFASAHEGFSPPRTEDLIDNNGFQTHVNAEKSRNLEAGIRSNFGALSLDATLFRTDFDTQIAVGSIAGGSVPLAEGETRYEGLELAAYTNFENLFGWNWTPYAQLAWTWLPTADLESAFTRVDNRTLIPGALKGNRLPYAPEYLVTASIGAKWSHGLDAHLELVYVDDQYADFANTREAAVNGNGQFGEISSYNIWNISLNWTPETWPVTLFTTVKNIGGKKYIVDRTRGILTSPPRMVQAGVEVRF
ncbi:MAG: TonB-dependent receptor [Gammaproteobacteria bacterium]|nr:TonB-dependent receptor [Gammaproteobacteria bacterium]